jgi:triosephosphate isomerase
MFAENNEGCKIKVRTALSHGLLPVLCVGENQQQREANITEQVLFEQLRGGLADTDLTGKDLCVAYEPVWAIGTGLAATPAIAQEVHQCIRAELARIFDQETANRVRILYGGSVTKSNASDLLQQTDIDGLLVGGASLDPGHFVAICEQASELAALND